ncbi:hypothetical protein Tco_1219154 [Tanacetum coccineum]
MKEVAKQELKLLEAQHPSGYQYLKLQLKEFIHVLEEQEQDQQAFLRKQQQFHMMSCMTQESSNVKRKRKVEKENDDDVHTKKRRGSERIKPGGAIQKAEACLRKIQALKKSFFGTSNH